MQKNYFSCFDVSPPFLRFRVKKAPPMMMIKSTMPSRIIQDGSDVPCCCPPGGGMI